MKLWQEGVLRHAAIRQSRGVPCGLFLVFLFSCSLLSAQQTVPEKKPAQTPKGRDVPLGLPEKAIVFQIDAKVFDEANMEVWASSGSKVTISGKPVSLRLVGNNVVVLVMFTPYLKQDGAGFLVAQGQIWVEVPGKGMSYRTTLQTIPVALGETIYFLPLGANELADNSIEIKVEIKPLSGDEGKIESSFAPPNFAPSSSDFFLTLSPNT
jgi:hypothetical protein